MSYRIITYRDPYHLENTSIWEEIHDCPHFCASSVMAMSMWDLYHWNKKGSAFSSFFFPLDDLVSVTYSDWENNVEKKIQQYSAISWWLNEWEKADCGRRPTLFSALRQNRNDLLEALRMFCELDIEPGSLKEKLANKEQQVFIILYQYIRNYKGDEFQTTQLRKAFELSDCKIHQNQAFLDLVDEAIKEELHHIDDLSHNNKDDDETQMALKKRDERKERLEELKKRFAVELPKKIVVHGIHQFKPLQIRLIEALNEAGYEIIFLFNYLSEYHHIYETWERLYSLFDVPIEHSEIIREYESDVQDKTSMELAEVMAGVLNAKAPVCEEDRSKWMILTEKVEYSVYENSSEMANDVAKMIIDHKDENTTNERIINKLPEKIYSASRDADDLLKVYFPEYAGDRHFLQYPVGQFFAHLYRMWDEEQQQLVVDIPSMKACAVSGILNPGGEERISGLLDLIVPLIEDVSLFSDVEARLMDYSKAWKKTQSGIYKSHLKHIALYNKNQIDENDIKELLDFLRELKVAAEFIFYQKGTISFQDHFRNLESFIRSRADQLVHQEEKSLVNDLLERFDNVSNTTDMQGTMDDLRQGLYFYMSQNNKERPGWVIRNFEQIEGDVLKSKSQVKSQKDEEIIYHFAALSDGMICKKTDDLLPWPLTDYFTYAVYSPVALVFQVYYCALSDRAAYMQYALFYGLQYNRGKVKLSYIRHIEEKKEEQFYYPLQILNLRKCNSDFVLKEPDIGEEELFVPDSLPFSDLNRYEKMDFFLCPYRYYLDYICSSEIVHIDSFLVKKCYESMLTNLLRGTFKTRKLTEQQIRSYIEYYQNELDYYFPFLKTINDKSDIRQNVVNYIIHNCVDKEGKISADKNNHGIVREKFINAAFFQPEDSHIEHPFESIRQLVTDDVKHNNYGDDERRKKYSLITTEDKNYPILLKNAIKEYINNDPVWEEHPGKWCTFCRYRGLCKKPYTKSVEE